MKYLFSYTANIYNNPQPSYELSPLPESDVVKCVSFAGQFPAQTMFPRCVYIYLETNKPITDGNRYRDVYLLEQLLYLATWMPVRSQNMDISQDKNFETIFEQYKANEYYEKGVRYSGRLKDEDTIERLQTYCNFIKRLSTTDLEKFENALQTYTWAREMEDLPNPHLKYTLFMTLYLSAINQLADNPKPKCPSHLVCPDCSKKVNMKHQDGSHSAEMEKLIRHLMTGSNLGEGIKRVKRLYSDLRSDYLHDGLLSGAEREGGFLGDNVEQHIELAEDMFNTAHLVRQLLELFIQDRARNSPAAE